MSQTRLDVYVSESQGITRSNAQRLIENGNVKVNGKSADKSYRIQDTDEVTVDVPPVQSTEIVPQNIPLDIVYEDKDIIVVNKPKGMVVHPAAGNYDGTLVNALLYHCGDNLSHIDGEDEEGLSIGGFARPGIVHRIDKDTSGLLVVAKNDKAHLFLSENIKSHKTERYYHAVVQGIPQDGIVIDAPIGRDRRDRKKMAITSDGRSARTHVKVLQEFHTPSGSFAHVQLQLETGRTHQIRVHMASKGHPCIGDTLYGGDGSRFARENAEILCGQCLHAKTLCLTHPSSGEELTFDSELPQYFQTILEKLRKISER